MPGQSDVETTDDVDIDQPPPVSGVLKIIFTNQGASSLWDLKLKEVNVFGPFDLENDTQERVLYARMDVGDGRVDEFTRYFDEVQDDNDASPSSLEVLYTSTPSDDWEPPAAWNMDDGNTYYDFAEMVGRLRARSEGAEQEILFGKIDGMCPPELLVVDGSINYVAIGEIDLIEETTDGKFWPKPTEYGG
jgi:hypothetical protein